ncbi:hypothetical protein T484DRAFT_1763119 [Baffinella frigidus]|nr:hypothetical protein T484DRAFT_1763119 [Cryptophyta sp. CCMP2293]
MGGVALPRAEGFLYCITLRFGVYLIALFDFVSGIMTLGSFLLLMMLDPDFASKDAGSLLHEPGSSALGSGTGFGGMRAVLFLACCSCIFAWPGAWAARVGDAKGVRVYLNFKIMQHASPSVTDAK